MLYTADTVRLAAAAVTVADVQRCEELPAVVTDDQVTGEK